MDVTSFNHGCVSGILYEIEVLDRFIPKTGEFYGFIGFQIRHKKIQEIFISSLGLIINSNGDLLKAEVCRRGSLGQLKHLSLPAEVIEKIEKIAHLKFQTDEDDQLCENCKLHNHLEKETDENVQRNESGSENSEKGIYFKDMNERIQSAISQLFSELM